MGHTCYCIERIRNIRKGSRACQKEAASDGSHSYIRVGNFSLFFLKRQSGAGHRPRKLPRRTYTLFRQSTLLSSKTKKAKNGFSALFFLFCVCFWNLFRLFPAKEKASPIAWSSISLRYRSFQDEFDDNQPFHHGMNNRKKYSSHSRLSTR